MIHRKVVGWAAIGLALVGAGVLGAIRDYRYGGDLVWASGYRQGLQQAQTTHRPVLISFRSSACDWCRKMDAETFTDPRVVSLTHDYVCVSVDALREPALIRQYHITDFPVTLIADGSGLMKSRLDGFATPEQLISVLKNVVER